MGVVKLILNGKQIKVDENKTILQVARENGIEIPTLCYDTRLEPFGSCRVCLVKVEGAKTFVPSCSTKVTEGMVVETNSPEIIEARHMSLALLISEHYGDCLSPCTLQCPARIDIQGYIALIRAGKYREAVKLIKEKNPMPVTIGRICPRPCEEVCRRIIVDEPVAINNLKRFAADYDIAGAYPIIPEKEPPNEKKIAVIGSGPAGLSASYYLALMGYNVTIFEKSPHAGGMLRYGIPEYRLPKKILDREIELILGLGIEIRYGVELGRDITIEDLKRDKYSAVFIGIGAQKSIGLRIDGENLPGVISGIGFLEDVASGKRIDLAGKNIIVVGGGNTAMDAARTALRLGANKVSVVYRRTRKEMPAHDLEIAEAEEEGVDFQFLSAPVRISKDHGLLRIECIRMELGEPDASGRRRPVPITGSEYTLGAHYLIAAIGQQPDTGWIKDPEIVTSKETLKADPETGATADPFIFAGGDCVTGAATAIEAIAAGRRAALSIDIFIKTGKIPSPELPQFNISKGSIEDIPVEYFTGYKKIPRTGMQNLSPSIRIRGFDEVEKGFSEKEALREASRCLECGCIEAFSCALRKYSTTYGIAQDEYTGEKNHYEEFNNIIRNHPPILRDENKCIKCGTCVRICDEVWGLNILGYVRRGFGAEIRPYFGLPLEKTACDFCGQCADACPTGALSLNTYLPKPGPFKEEKKEGICILCNLGCELEYNIYENMLLRCTGIPGKGENEGNLCVRGRFGFSYLMSPQRFIYPLEFIDGKREQLTFDDSLNKASELLSRSKKIGIFTSTNLSNEEYEKIYELAKTLPWSEVYHIPYDFAEYDGGVGVRAKSDLYEGDLEKIESSGSPGLDSPSYPIIGKVKPLESIINLIEVSNLSELHKEEVIFLFNIYPGRSFPILEFKIRQAVKRGVKLYIVNENPTRLDDYADGVFRVKELEWSDFLNLIALFLRPSLSSIPAEARKYYAGISPNRDILMKYGIKKEKVIRLSEELKTKRVVFISDEDKTSFKALNAFVMLAYLCRRKAKLLLMNRGTNPAGAESFINGSGRGEVSLKIALSFDTVLFYKLPKIFSLEDRTIINVDFKPWEDYGRYGLFIPSSSLLECGGGINLYNGKKVRLKGVLKNEHGLDNVHTLTEIIQRTLQFSQG